VARRYSWLVVVGLTLVGIFIINRVLRTGGGLPPVGQDSPQALLRKAQRALAEGNRAAFLECVATRSGNHAAAAEALFDYVRAAYALRDALREIYGKDGWERFVAAQGMPAPFAAFIWPRGEDVAATAKVVVEGNQATAEVVPDAEPLALRLEGVWRIEPFPRGSGVRGQREALARATEALRKAREQVGKGGATPESLAQEARKQAAAEP